MLKTSGAVQLRSRAVARGAWWGVVALTILTTWFTFRIQPQVSMSFAAHSWGYVFPAIAVAGLVALRWFLAGADDVRRELEVFLASCAYLLGMLTSVVFGLYPYVLPASSNPAYSLSIYNAKAGAYGLRVGLVWWFVGIGLATVYFVIVYWHFKGKVNAQGSHESY
jgi:cytochrome d ubiquinol oxidase subunit II